MDNDPMLPYFDQHPMETSYSNDPFDVEFDLLGPGNDHFNIFSDNLFSDALSDDFLHFNDNIFVGELNSITSGDNDDGDSKKKKKPKKTKTIRINVAKNTTTVSSKSTGSDKRHNKSCSILNNSSAPISLLSPKARKSGLGESPKVYFSKVKSSKSQKRTGTSILLKQPKSMLSADSTKPVNNKSVSLLKGHTPNSVIIKPKSPEKYYFLYDHDYCGGGKVITEEDLKRKEEKAKNISTCETKKDDGCDKSDDIHSGQEKKKADVTNMNRLDDAAFAAAHFAQTCKETEDRNNLLDYFDNFVPDDVMLNELPNCLQDLVGLTFMNDPLDSPDHVGSSDMCTVNDVLGGLSDACDFIESQYIKELKIDNQTPLPDLNLTEDDLDNLITQADNANSASATPTEFMTPATSPAPLMDIDDTATNILDLIQDIIFPESSEKPEESVFVSTNVTKSLANNNNNQSKPIKSERNRSISSTFGDNTSSVNKAHSNRKRHFSSRTSMTSTTTATSNGNNSCGELSECSDSSAESSISSRSSSPERTFTGNFKNIIPKGSKFHLKFNKGRIHPKGSPEKNGTRRLFTFRDLSKSKEKKLAAARQAHHKPLVRGNAGGCTYTVNEKVLYIGDISNGCTKAQLRKCFERYGSIEDVQLYFCEGARNYAFVTYRSAHETQKAIKYANNDLGKSYKLSYGRRRIRTYQDRDMMIGDSSLDFRIEDTKFDQLMRSFNM